jgi:hypothetical protein
MSINKNGTGYKRPPAENQFKPGKSGNPKGRPKKQLANTSRASLLDDILSEEIDVGGQTMTKLEVLLRSICTNAIKGSGTAIRVIEKMLAEQATGKQVRGGGVLVVPGTMPLDEWSAAAAIQQAKYREKDYGKPAEEDEYENKGET